MRKKVYTDEVKVMMDNGSRSVLCTQAGCLCIVAIQKIRRRQVMKQWKKRGIVMATVFSLAAASLAGCAGNVNPEETLVTVGDTEVSYGVVNYYARLQQAQYESYYASMLGTTGEAFWSQAGSDGKNYADTIKEGVMEDIQELYLIKQHAAEYGAELTEAEKTSIEETAKQFVSENSQEERDAVSGDEKYVKEYLTLLTIEKKMDPLMTADVDEEVSDEEAAQKAMDYIYVSYSTKDADGNSVDMSDEEKAALKADVQTALDELKAGKAEFAVVAAALGETVQTATFDAESYSPNSDLVAAADALAAVGDVTELVETDNGIYVARLTSLLDRDATDSKKESIVEQRKNEQFEYLLEQWKEETEITVNEKLWKKIDFRKLGVTVKQSETE